jgi:hypothetical protein
MLKGCILERSLPIFRRLNQIYHSENLEVLLGLAIRYWLFGLDDRSDAASKN